MGSDLYEVVVKEVKDKTVKLTIRCIHPDSLTLPATKTFAFQLLMGPLWDWQDEVRERTRGMPLSNEICLHDSWDKQYITASAGGFIESVHLDATRHYPMSQETYLKVIESDEPDRLPEGDYTITVTHPGWLLHLAPGMTWDSRDYDMGESKDWEGKRRVPGDMTWIRAPNQSEGFVIAQPDDYTEHIASELMVPQFSPEYYEPDPALIGDKITIDNLQELILKPVALRVRDSIYEVDAGVLLEIKDNRITIYHQTPFSRGIQCGGITRLVYIGPARYRKRIYVL